MKYALSIFTLTILAAFSTSASARTITSFKDSDALTTVAQFMYDVAEDVPMASRIADTRLNVTDFSNCATVPSHEIVSEIETSIKRVLRYYPDEDIPFEQAIVDLEDYLDNQNFRKCSFMKKASQSGTKTTYYVDSSDKIHLRLDNVALMAE